MVSRRQTAALLADQLLAHLPPNALDDLAVRSDTAAAVAEHFSDLRVVALPRLARWSSVDCSCDGFYENTLGPPAILYADDVADERARFTILHELGHHLLQHNAAALLDEIDRVAGNGRAQQIEELVCHAFAGRLLIPNDLLNQVVVAPIVPDHVVALHDRSRASWEACAVRSAECLPGAGAIVLLRKEETIGFAAASPALDPWWWPRGAAVAPDGPLARALRVQRQVAQSDDYRARLPGSTVLYCDTLRVHDRLAVAVLCEQPSRRPDFQAPGTRRTKFEIDEHWCEDCTGRLAGEWCGTCRSRRCVDCQRCRCTRVRKNPLCPGCGLLNPKRTGADLCFDCERDAT